jgi:four helix bundle protein
MGSANETEYHILLAHDLGFLQDEEYQQLTDQIVEIKKMIVTVMKTLSASRKASS